MIKLSYKMRILIKKTTRVQELKIRFVFKKEIIKATMKKMRWP